MALGLSDEQRRALELTGGNANMFAPPAEEPLDFAPVAEPPVQAAATEAARTSDWRSGTVPAIEEAEATRLADGPPAPEQLAAESAAYLAATGKRTDDRSADEIRNSTADFTGDTGQGYTSVGANGMQQTWKNGKMVEEKPMPDMSNLHLLGTQPGDPVQRNRSRQGPVPVDDVEDRIWNPNASSRTLRGEQTAGQNRALELEEQTKGAIKAEGAERKAAELNELRAIQREGREGVAQRVALNREQKQQFEQRMLQRMDEISDKIRNPPKDTMGMVMGIIAAAMSAGGNGGAAALVNGIGQAMNTKMKKWEAGLAADQAELGHLKTMFGMQNDDSESELKQEAQLSSLAVAEFDSALRQVGEETQSKEARAIAEQARLDLRNKYVQHSLDIRQRAATQQAAAQQDQELYKFIASQPTPEARAAAAAQFGSKGQAVLQNIQKSDKGAADIDSTAAGTEKTRIEAAKAAFDIGKGPGGKVDSDVVGSHVPGGYQVVDEGAWRNTPEPVRTAFVKAQGALPGITSKLERLKQMMATHGTENWPTDAKREMEALYGGALGDIKEVMELGALDNGVERLVQKMLPDPTGYNMGLGNWVENGPAKIDQTIQFLRQQAGARARTFGLGTALKAK